MAPSASVVVPARREAGRLSRCLSSLAGQDAEVVVVAGDEGTAAVARADDTTDRVVRDDGAGAGAARNRGVEAATGDLVLFTDADTVVPHDWVATHRRRYDDESVVGVGGPARPLDGTRRDELLFKLLSDYWYRVSWPLGFVQLPTFNCSYRRSTFDEHGGFDEEIPFMEDTELSLRVKGAGRLVYEPATRVATSARRERDEGYVSVFCTYARAYVSHYVLGREFDGDYFGSR